MHVESISGTPSTRRSILQLIDDLLQILFRTAYFEAKSDSMILTADRKQRLRYEILAVLGLYMFFSLAYSWALYFTTGGQNFLSNTSLDYVIKGILTLPVWWLIFWKFRDLTAWKRYVSHVVFLPIWVFCWMKAYYFFTELTEIGHLGGTGIGWDIYIPAMFYIIQFGIFHLYDESRRLVQQTQRSVELREVAMKSELTALKAQLNPHFLYNVFNTINASLPPDQEYTRELVAKLADMFRYQLKASKSETVILQDELEFVRSYLELEKARYQERLQVEWKIEEDLLGVHVPPMILQPLVENAIRHGISPLIEGGTVSIQAMRKDGQLQLVVSDNGVGFSVESSMKGSGVGLANTQKLLENMYQRSLVIERNEPQGTKVCFQLPLIGQPLLSKA
ncbi:MAG: histidine kinase [Bacteroidota bacterium]